MCAGREMRWAVVYGELRPWPPARGIGTFMRRLTMEGRQ